MQILRHYERLSSMLITLIKNGDGFNLAVTLLNKMECKHKASKSDDL